jgi:hypothetical protein
MNILKKIKEFFNPHKYSVVCLNEVLSKRSIEHLDTLLNKELGLKVYEFRLWNGTQTLLISNKIITEDKLAAFNQVGADYMLKTYQYKYSA